jgi:hypothetical protein
MKAVDQNRESILKLLLSKSALKQDVSQNTKNHFLVFKQMLRDEITNLKSKLTDERVRCQFMDKSEYEAHVFIGSDVIVFMMHTNIFKLPDNNNHWQLPYLLKEPTGGYTGMINVYNFLAESFVQNRYEDAGYLIGRVFINFQNQFFVEGKGDLGILFKDFGNLELTDKIIKHIVQCSFAYALEFDLLTPPYEVMAQVSVGQIMAIGTSLHIQTGKRLGFQFKVEENDIT